MTPARLLYVSAGVLLFFAVAHTGGMVAAPPGGAEGQALMDAMAALEFDMIGATCTHFAFYRGEGWYLTAALLVVGALHAEVGRLSTDHPSVARRLLWPLMGFDVVSVALCIQYFFAPPLICSVIALILDMAAWVMLEELSAPAKVQGEGLS